MSPLDTLDLLILRAAEAEGQVRVTGELRAAAEAYMPGQAANVTVALRLLDLERDGFIVTQAARA